MQLCVRRALFPNRQNQLAASQPAHGTFCCGRTTDKNAFSIRGGGGCHAMAACVLYVCVCLAECTRLNYGNGVDLDTTHPHVETSEIPANISLKPSGGRQTVGGNMAFGPQTRSHTGNLAPVLFDKMHVPVPAMRARK